ncbi:VOC family protein [Streptomyces litchfieldiae]|uniref:VOC family protein n=1 Tax=Streptomyces litchfieldiae TaxID=3075543 RepID=A0ABU2MKA0_9ACTN|nr:VOC family protein [Streptomyces sp. DSM 44938]MDT0341534.1 VOC family protein [Streptomyces sp. DSM 44938]
MITTDFLPGSPCWLDLGAPDIGAAAAFYGTVFGWEFESFGPDAGGYGVFRLGGKTVAGLGPLTEEGARSAWMVYFATPDAEAAARTVTERGGTVRVAPLTIEGESRMAQFSDPQGGQFAVLQAPGSQGLEAVDVTGSLTWTELYTTDVGAAKEFYGALFGWTTSDMELPGGGGTYALITPAGAGEDRMQGGIMQLPPEALDLTGGRPYWHPVFGSADCDATVALLTGKGGSVQMGPEDAEGVGRLAVCTDPFGADFVVLKPVEG